MDGGYGWVDRCHTITMVVHYHCGLVDCNLGGWGAMGGGVVGEWMGVVDRGLLVEAVGGWVGYGLMMGVVGG